MGLGGARCGAKSWVPHARYRLSEVFFGFFCLILQLMENATHTFLQLSQQHLGQVAGRRRLTQALGKVKERVLKVRRGSLSMGLFRWSLFWVFFSVEHPPCFAAFPCLSALLSCHRREFVAKGPILFLN